MDNAERLKLSAEMDKAAEEHELAETEVDSLRPFYKSLAGIHVRRVEADRLEKLAEEYRQMGMSSPPGGAVDCAERAETYTADAAYLRAEADRMEQQFGFTAEEVSWARAEVREMRAEQALVTAFRKLGHWEWSPATDEEGGGPTGPHPLFIGDATEPTPGFDGDRAVWRPAGCDFRQRVIGGERPDECPTFWADDAKCVCDLPVDWLPTRIQTSLDNRYLEGRQDAMNGRSNPGRVEDEDYRRGHNDALVEQIAAVSRENTPPKPREYVEGWQDAMNGRYNTGMEDYEDYWRGHHYGSAERARMKAARRENRITEVNNMAAQVLAKQLTGGSEGVEDALSQIDEEAAAGRGRECPDGLPDCPQCALNRRVETANAAAGVGERVPRGLLPTAVIWEDEDTGGWRVAFSDGECAGMSLGSFLGVDQARAAAGRLGYKEDRQFVYPMAGGPFRRLCDYTGEITGGSEGIDLLETRELRSSYLVTARSDDDAIAAALAECADYLDELLEDHGLAFDEPPVFAVIDVEEPDGKARRIYARPAGVFRPATAYYTGPENEHNRAELFTDDPHPGDLCWTADGWAPANGGEPPPIVIRSGDRLDARIRDFRGDNTRGAGLSL